MVLSFPLSFLALAFDWGLGPHLASLFLLVTEFRACRACARCVHSVVGWPRSGGQFQFSVPAGVALAGFTGYSVLFLLFLCLCSVAAGPPPFVS